MRLASHVQQALSAGARAIWPLAARVNRLIPEGKFLPRWSGGAALEKTREKSFPPLGFPRETDSLCPECVKDVRARVLAALDGGRLESLDDLRTGRPGEIKAVIKQVADSIVMEKTCPEHGRFEDVMSIDAAFFGRLERLYPGRDFKLVPDALHDHGSSTIKYGRGAVLTIDLTNRCNMMCDPCFMDANQVGYVHELTLADVKKILDDAIQVKPRRQLSVQFSGGEPTMSPHFLDAVRYAREVGYFSVQCASNGVRFAQDLEYARAAKEAGLRFVYLQFDGVTDVANAHRGVSNLFLVKRRAIENIYASLMSVALVVTVVNGVNHEQIGPIVRFAIENIEKLHTVSFQPVSFTGRDEDLPAPQRAAWRYTLSHLARDLAQQMPETAWEPMRDWFPLSASGTLSDLADLLQGPQNDWGSVKCGCHPNCGIGSFLLVHKREKQAWPVTSFFDLEGFLEDVKEICDGARPKAITAAMTGVALLKRFDATKAPMGLTLLDLATLLRQKTGASSAATSAGVDGHKGKQGAGLDDRGDFPWKLLFVGGMWFQDLFNYDFRRTEMCIIPYATQMGEISFCAYNTGLGWRKIVERMYQFGSVNKWYREEGRHEIFAKGKSVPLPEAPAREQTLRAEWERGEVSLTPSAGGGGTDVVYADGSAKKARPKPLPLVQGPMIPDALVHGAHKAH